MAVLLLTIDFKAPDHDYTPIFTFIKNMNVWARITDTAYTVETHMTPQDVLLELRPHLSRNDSLYVLTLASPWIGYGPDDVNAWLRERLG